MRGEGGGGFFALERLNMGLLTRGPHSPSRRVLQIGPDLCKGVSLPPILAGDRPAVSLAGICNPGRLGGPGKPGTPHSINVSLISHPPLRSPRQTLQPHRQTSSAKAPTPVLKSPRARNTHAVLSARLIIPTSRRSPYNEAVAARPHIPQPSRRAAVLRRHISGLFVRRGWQPWTDLCRKMPTPRF
jgi:hypothetical protein